MTISALDIDKARISLSQWQSPDSFGKTLKDARAAFDSKTFFRCSRLTSFREAWVGLQLARVLDARAIRLGDDAWPDLWIRFADTEGGFEIVEVMEKGRKRGDENWDSAQLDPYEDWVKRAEQIPGQLRQSVHKKCMKGYPPTAGLLVYLNIHEWGIAQKETEASMHDATSEARNKFTQVWVFWKERFYLLWDEGQENLSVFTSDHWKEGFADD